MAKKGNQLANLFDMMDRAGVTMPKDLRQDIHAGKALSAGQLRQVKRALLRLKERLQVDYRHQTDVGEMQSHATTKFAQQALGALAAPNTGRHRRQRRQRAARGTRSRKERSPGRRRARRNPLSQKAVQAAMEYLGSGQESPELKSAFRKLRESGAAKEMQLTPEALSTLFPHEGKAEAWDPRSRIPTALGSSFDLVTRAGAPEPPSAAVRKAMAAGDSPLSAESAIEYMMGTAGLSLMEAQQILAVLKESAGRKGKYGGRLTMQTSSAICKLYRTRKLGAYRAGDELLDKTGKYAVVILMSPPEQQPRVMTWRRGSHLDCDMVGKNPASLPDLLGKSIQSALYWVAEKPARQLRTVIYVGRVGTPELTVVWQPKQSLSLATATANLLAGAQKPYQTVDSANADRKRYSDALQETFGRPLLPIRPGQVFEPDEHVAEPEGVPIEPASRVGQRGRELAMGPAAGTLGGGGLFGEEAEVPAEDLPKSVYADFLADQSEDEG